MASRRLHVRAPRVLGRAADAGGEVRGPNRRGCGATEERVLGIDKKEREKGKKYKRKKGKKLKVLKQLTAVRRGNVHLATWT